MGKHLDGNVSVAEAARRLGMSGDTLRQCLIQNKLPINIGFAIKKDGNTNYTYYINEYALRKLEKEWGFTD